MLNISVSTEIVHKVDNCSLTGDQRLIKSHTKLFFWEKINFNQASIVTLLTFIIDSNIQADTPDDAYDKGWLIFSFIQLCELARINRLLPPIDT